MDLPEQMPNTNIMEIPKLSSEDGLINLLSSPKDNQSDEQETHSGLGAESSFNGTEQEFLGHPESPSIGHYEPQNTIRRPRTYPNQGPFQHEQHEQHLINPAVPPACPPLKYGEFGPQTLFRPTQGASRELCMPVVQKRYERCTGPPFGHAGSRPSPECELFVGKVSKDVYEDRIFAVFSRFGPIYQIRIKTKRSGSSQGYFYVHFYQEEAAEHAVSQLNGCKLFGDKNGIRLKQTVQIKRIFVTGIPDFLTNQSVFELMRETNCVNGLTDIDVPQHFKQNRSYCFLEFNNHHAALAAWKWILELKPFGTPVGVNWALPETARPEDPEQIGSYFCYKGPWLRTHKPFAPFNVL